MYNDEVENLIDLAMADGSITESEKQVLLTKAEAMGIDLTEFEAVLERKLSLHKNTGVQQGKTIKCPSCGEVVDSFTKVCPSCNSIIPSSGRSTALDESVETLEDIIVDIKALPRPSFLTVVKVIFFTWITLGLYIVYKKVIRKESILSNVEEFNELVADSEKEIRKIKVSYGENARVKKLLEEVQSELDALVKQRRQKRLQAILIGVGTFVGFWMIGILTPDHERNVTKLLYDHKFEQARAELKNVQDDGKRKDLADQITLQEVDYLVDQNKYTEAYNKALTLSTTDERNTRKDLIISKEVEIFIAQKNYKEARATATLLTNDARKDMLKRITYLKRQDKVAEEKLDASEDDNSARTDVPKKKSKRKKQRS